MTSSPSLVSAKAQLDKIIGISADIQREMNKVLKAIDPERPLTVSLDLGDLKLAAEDMADTFQRMKAPADSAPAAAYDLGSHSPALRRMIVANEVLISQGVSLLAMLESDELILRNSAKALMSFRDLFDKWKDTLYSKVPWLAVFVSDADLAELAELPDAYLDAANQAGWRADAFRRHRIQRALTRTAESEHALQALTALETATKKSIEDNRAKLTDAQQMQANLAAATEAGRQARYAEIEAAEILFAAQARADSAGRGRNQAADALSKAKQDVTDFEDTIAKGAFECPDGYPLEDCNHFTDRADHEKKLNNALNKIDGAKKRLNKAVKDKQSADKEMQSSQANLTEAKTRMSIAERAVADAVERENNLRRTLQPKIDEILNLLFSGGTEDTLQAIAELRQRIAVLGLRAKKFTQ